MVISMKIRLGYACISKTINITSSTPYTYTSFSKEKDFDKLNNVIISNLEALEQIIDYNIKNNIHFYRMSSNIIPLATKDDVEFDYIDNFQSYYKRISEKIKNSNMRVDFHPDQFCVLNSVKEDVIKNSIAILEYHYNLLEALNINNKILILHIGSNVFGKEKSLKRFINSFNKLPNHLKKAIAIENDDKIFNVEDCLYLSDALNIPIVLDYHHHICNKSEFSFEKIFHSWYNKNPKIHYSSPKSKLKKEFRSHSDYINVDEFISFINELKSYDQDVDVMIEAKMCDDALFKLIRQLKYKTDYKFIDETTFIV